MNGLEKPEEGRRRVVIEGVTPEIDGGRFPIKRCVGDMVAVEADVFCDGEEQLSCVLNYRRAGTDGWHAAAMGRLVNDRWRGEFLVTEMGTYLYTLEAWVDHFQSWRGGLVKKVEAGHDVSVDLLIGLKLIEEAQERAEKSDAVKLKALAGGLRGALDKDQADAVERALGRDLSLLMASNPDKRFSTLYDKELKVHVDGAKARFSTWYEMFPRSCASDPSRQGTFRDCEERLAYITAMGFDTLYLPPIHPIGETHRKGKNNSPEARPGEPGSPWAIGSKEGGHKAIHPALGSLEDFRRLVRKSKDYGIEIALDVAFQCSPDHPYVREHPEWFRSRPDGTIQYAENPPKKYQDIYPINFETDDWRALWEELKSVVLFWISQGVRIFRVDNPHTKPFAFWEWLIGEVKSGWPAVIFLSEAFTRPKVMLRLAKLGFTHSYTYFAWRNTKWEITEYFTELSQPGVREYFRPHLWPNTPDILTEYLQAGGRPAFMARLVLAGTLSANYGIYGPTFELCGREAKEAGSEEYMNSEKYEVRHWDIHREDGLKDFVARVNRIRRENACLQADQNLRFHPVDNDHLVCYSKRTDDFGNAILVVVNIDPHYTQSGWVDLALEQLDLDPLQPYQVHDLLTDARYLWQGSRNYVELNPHVVPAHIFRLRRRVRTERDFDYFA